MTSLITVALGLGIAGSLHCAGMCGPLLLSVSLIKKNKTSFYSEMFTHHSGRIFAYSILGLIAGSMGQVLASGGLQQKLSILAGTSLLLILALPYFFQRKSKFSIYLKGKWARFINKQGLTNSFALGIVNGLLPCGLVYAALASAAATGSYATGVLFMFLFGLGTLPLLLLITFGGLKLNLRTKKLTNYILPMATLITACLLILRGMNLGIPYLSPTFEAETISCCESSE